MDVASFGNIEAEFAKRTKKIVWCTVTTIDQRGRPRSRILHPIWEGSTGWIATGRHTLKTRHLSKNPFVSLSYWDPEHQQVYAECKAEWEDDQAEKDRVWTLLKTTEPPLGYDPGLFWTGGSGDPGYGLLKLTPWRIELFSVQDMAGGTPPRVWRQHID